MKRHIKLKIKLSDKMKDFWKGFTLSDNYNKIYIETEFATE